MSGHQLGRRRFNGLRPFRILTWSFLLGIPVLITGFLRNVPDNGPNAYRGAPLIAAGLVMTLIPTLITAIWLFVVILKLAIEEHRRYRAWKATLSPQERFAVDMAEAAAMWAQHLRLREHHKRVQHKNTVSALGYDPATSVSQRPDPFSRNNPYWTPPQ